MRKSMLHHSLHSDIPDVCSCSPARKCKTYSSSYRLNLEVNTPEFVLSSSFLIFSKDIKSTLCFILITVNQLWGWLSLLRQGFLWHMAILPEHRQCRRLWWQSLLQLPNHTTIFMFYFIVPILNTGPFLESSMYRTPIN